MRDLIEDRFNTFAWLGQARQNPIQSNLMLKLVRAGYSPALARAILERMPERWARRGHAVDDGRRSERNIHTDAGHARCTRKAASTPWWAPPASARPRRQPSWPACAPRPTARQRRPDHAGHTARRCPCAVARTRRMLGLVAHLAHDRAALQDLLGLFSARRWC
jgi:flagellar biosynthesis protein FlhF